MTTLDALSRKNRFLKNKKKFGGAENVIKNSKETPYKLYFDQQGTIVCLTKENVEVLDGWQTHDFDKQTLFDLKYFEKDLHLYHVILDEEGQFRIAMKPTHVMFKPADRTGLEPITTSDSDGLLITVSTHQVVFEMTPDLKKQFNIKYPISATVKGKRIFNFYFCPKDDLNTYVRKETISMIELLTNEKIIKYPPADMRQYAVLTVPLFDKYNVIVK